MRPVQHVNRVHPHLQVDFLLQPQILLHAGVHDLEAIRSQAIDARGEDARLESGGRFGRSLLEAGVHIEPALEGRTIHLDVVELAVEEQVAPAQNLSRLDFGGPGDLPTAGDVAQYSAPQEGTAAAEWQLVNASRGEMIRTRG